MQRFLLTCTAAVLCLAGATAQAVTPNRTTMSFEEFVNASGCVIVDKGGYSNLAAVGGGNCPFAVTQAFIGGYTVLDAGPDGIAGTADDFSRSDN